MITNKDIRVENGYLIINGDKYPLDGQSPEAIMAIVEDNSDTTPTENSTAPITSGGVFTALGTKQDTLTFDTAPTENSTNPVESGGVFTSIATVAAQIGKFKTPAGVLAINDDAVKQLLIDADAGSITMAMVNPTTSGDSTPFTGQAYLLTSAKYDATRGSQYAIQIIGGTGKKQRLFDTTWSAWS